jgi:hypothetical protein
MAHTETDISLDDIEEDDETSDAKHRRESESRLKRRHYKKDSRFLLDLYTITFDEDQVEIHFVFSVENSKCKKT